MDVSGVAGKFSYPSLPSAQEVAAVLAARPAVSAQAERTAATVASNEATTQKHAEAVASGSVDMYL